MREILYLDSVAGETLEGNVSHKRSDITRSHNRTLDTHQLPYSNGTFTERERERELTDYTYTSTLPYSEAFTFFKRVTGS